MVRLQKFLAEAGVASRRRSEELITAGRVSVNGHVVSSLGTKVNPACDQVVLDGRRLKEKPKLYVAVNKPRGYVCTRADPQRRPLLAEVLPKDWPQLYPVGRLDLDSEGLIFLTNDGEFCLRVTHPRFGVRKKYWVTVGGAVSPHVVTRMTAGIQDEGDELRAERVRVLFTRPHHSQLEVELAEGRNREVRRLCEALGLKVKRLRRVQIGSVKLGDLRAGRWRRLTSSEVKAMLGKGSSPSGGLDASGNAPCDWAGRTVRGEPPRNPRQFGSPRTVRPAFQAFAHYHRRRNENRWDASDDARPG